MFRLTHFSDTHGSPFTTSIPESSIAVVHSGDLLPNLTRGIREEEIPYQREWLIANLPAVRRALGDRLFLFIRGNHDFMSAAEMEGLMRDAGIRATCLEPGPTNEVHTILGVRFYGFPYIPFIAGEWNFEARSAEMSDRVSAIPECDILVAHCPPFGICADVILGKGGGNAPLMNWLGYECPKLPRWLLCGHMHDSHGIGMFHRDNEVMLVSNAATTVHTLEIS